MREELGAFVVLMRHSGLEGMQYFPPHGAHARPEAALLFELVTLGKGGGGRHFSHFLRRNNCQAWSGSLNESVHVLRMWISQVTAGRMKV